MALRMFPRLSALSAAAGNSAASSCFRQLQVLAHPLQVRAFASGRKQPRVHDNMITAIATSNQLPNLNAKAGDRIKVKRGFFRNYLMRRKLAVYATPENMALFKVDPEAPVVTKSGVERKRKSAAAVVYDSEHANRISRIVLRLGFESDPIMPDDLVQPVSKFQIWKLLRRRYVLPHLTIESLHLPLDAQQITTFGTHTLTADVRGANGDLQQIPFRLQVVDTRVNEKMNPVQASMAAAAAAAQEQAALGGSFS